MTKRWVAEYRKLDCLWHIISPLGVTVTRCYNKRQTMELLSFITEENWDYEWNEELNHGETKKEDDEENGIIF